MERRRHKGKKLAPKYLTGKAQEEKKLVTKRKKLSQERNAKSNKLVVKQRISVIHEFNILGYPPHEILKYVNEGGLSGNDEDLRWGISYGQMMYYRRKANVIGDEIINADIKSHYTDSIKRWTVLIRKFHKEGDNTNLAKATKELDELLNLRKTNINISGLLNVKDVTGLTDEALDAAIKEAEESLE